MRLLQTALRSETDHRPMDLRVGDLRAAKVMQTELADHAGALDDRPAWDLRLRIGSHIAAEARAAVKVGPHFVT